MRRLLVVTNDFPPRPGGIQSFVHGVVSHLPPDQVVVLSSQWRSWQDFDAAQPFPVIRHGTTVLLPEPRVRRHARHVFRDHGCTDVWFGAAAPLGLLAGSLRAAGAHRIVATTHGHEAGWAMLPGARTLMSRIAANVDVLTYLGDYTRRRLLSAVRNSPQKLQQLTPAVDGELFSPDPIGGRAIRERLGLADRPVIVCVSRLMPRKGQDVLIEAMPHIQRRIPDAALLLVGGGPSRDRLRALADRHGVAEDIRVCGSVPSDQLARWYSAGDVFAMPCRERLHGLDVEGLGMVFLEAAACGLPVIVGNSGGAPGAVIDGTTGLLVDPHDSTDVARALTGVLSDPQRAATMGKAGRDWVNEQWSWDTTVTRLMSMLEW